EASQAVTEVDKAIVEEMVKISDGVRRPKRKPDAVIIQGYRGYRRGVRMSDPRGARYIGARRNTDDAVTYKHLTLPRKRSGEISGKATSLKITTLFHSSNLHLDVASISST
ncbi:hypothetical protein, partial [Lysobacter sp. A03]|uniref:hypothetical protein n=1 Tax=Lysobacter sp. A03 TaxID=1199154 RepID=UPI001F264166